MVVAAEQKKSKQSMALLRLHAALEMWERDKTAGDWLYVCARRSGEKLRSTWIGPSENSSESIDQNLADALKKATSFEVEWLHSPEVRRLSTANKNKWNSLRGKRAMEIVFGGKTTRWAATDMLARNLSFSAALERHQASVETGLEPNSQVNVTLYKCRQWYCDCDPSPQGQATPVEMFRGNRLVDVLLINRNTVLNSAQAMTRWLAAQVTESGAANYKYWPSLGACASSNNAIRQWMATVCLNRAAKAFGSDRLAAIAAKNLAFNLSETYKNDGTQSYIWMDGSAKLGAAALAALAIFESPRRKAYIGAEYALNDLIDSLSNQDGSFDTFYIPRERKDNQNFYSGEALLFLASRFSASRNSVELDRIMAAFSYYRDWHRKNRNPAFVPWHTQAYFLVWQVTKDDALRDFIFEMNDWLLSMQQWETAEFPDMQGRFYDPARPHFGPPHASSTGVYLEGLIDAFWLAKRCGEHSRAEAYRVAIVRGIRSLMQLQYKDSVDCFYVKNVKCVLGGLRTTVYDNTIRIDNVQHGLMALLKVLSRFSESDYRVSGFADAHRKTLAPIGSKNYRHFRKVNFPIDVDLIRSEIEANDHLWFDNTSRQDNVKVQKETHTIFLRSAKKPFCKGFSGNDVQANCETKNASIFPIVMRTLREFAASIDGDLSRVTVVRLLPGSRVYPHVDEGEYYKYRDRYHIVVKSPSGSEMISGGERVAWQEGELWWFDNKAVHEANNHGNDFRVHIIFDVLPARNRLLVEDINIKQSLLIHPVEIIPSTRVCRLRIDKGQRVMVPDVVTPARFRQENSPFASGCYDSNAAYVDELDDVYIYGKKCVISDHKFRVYLETLPTYLHEPDPTWLDRKPFIRDELYGSDIVHLEEPCAIIANGNWKNYWHWHAQCVASVGLLKKTHWWGKVKLLVPPLTDWRRESLRALGVTDDMCIKISGNIVRAKKLIRPSFLNKKNQVLMHPSIQDTFDEIKADILGTSEVVKPSKWIYVARFDAAARRLANEHELAEYLKTKGFEILVPGNLSYQQQVKAFSEASVVVGPHGAGLTNIIFCPKGAKVIELFSEKFFYPEKFAYRAHCAIGDLDYFCSLSGDNKNGVDWIFDPREISRFNCIKFW